MYIDKLKKLNKKAIINGDIPVSCLIVKNGKIISKGYNKKYKTNNPLAHAEIIAIKKACKKLKTPNLIECEMYVTLKPCSMCQEIIKESKIKKVYYILDKTKIVKNKIEFKKLEIDNKYFIDELKKFFLNKR